MVAGDAEQSAWTNKRIGRLQHECAGQSQILSWYGDAPEVHFAWWVAIVILLGAIAAVIALANGIDNAAVLFGFCFVVMGAAGCVCYVLWSCVRKALLTTFVLSPARWEIGRQVFGRSTLYETGLMANTTLAQKAVDRGVYEHDPDTGQQERVGTRTHYWLELQFGYPVAGSFTLGDALDRVETKYVRKVFDAQQELRKAPASLPPSEQQQHQHPEPPPAPPAVAFDTLLQAAWERAASVHGARPRFVSERTPPGWQLHKFFNARWMGDGPPQDMIVVVNEVGEAVHVVEQSRVGAPLTSELCASASGVLMREPSIDLAQPLPLARAIKELLSIGGGQVAGPAYLQSLVPIPAAVMAYQAGPELRRTNSGWNLVFLTAMPSGSFTRWSISGADRTIESAERSELSPAHPHHGSPGPC